MFEPVEKRLITQRSADVRGGPELPYALVVGVANRQPARFSSPLASSSPTCAAALDWAYRQASRANRAGMGFRAITTAAANGNGVRRR
jgi:hypothetical protein